MTEDLIEGPTNPHPWVRFILGGATSSEVCSFCFENITLGSIMAWHFETGEPECGQCHWERIRSLVLPKKRRKKNMAWKRYAGNDAGEVTGGQPKATSNSNPILKWEEGVVLEGYWLRIKDGKFGKLFDFQTSTEFVTYPLTAALAEKLPLLPKDKRVRLTCLNKVPTAAGRTVWQFEIEVDE